MVLSDLFQIEDNSLKEVPYGPYQLNVCRNVKINHKYWYCLTSNPDHCFYRKLSAGGYYCEHPSRTVFEVSS